MDRHRHSWMYTELNEKIWSVVQVLREETDAAFAGKYGVERRRISLEEMAAVRGAKATAEGSAIAETGMTRWRRCDRVAEVARAAQQTEVPRCLRWKEQQVLALQKEEVSVSGERSQAPRTAFH